MSPQLPVQASLMTILLSAVLTVANAQEPPAAVAKPMPVTSKSEPEDELPVVADRLPKPLHRLQTNLRDLEQLGHLRLGLPRLQIRDDSLGEAVAWEVEVVRPVNARFVLWQLEKLRDVRFVRTAANRLQEAHATFLCYSPRLDEQAANGIMLFPNESFEIWIYLAPTEKRKIESANADRVILSERRR